MRRSALLLLIAVLGVSGLGFSGLFAAEPQMSVSDSSKALDSKLCDMHALPQRAKLPGKLRVVTM